MNKNIYHPYTNSDGKRVNGAVALNHYMVPKLYNLNQISF